RDHRRRHSARGGGGHEVLVLPPGLQVQLPGDARVVSVAILVLAAGGSRRLGSPKQLLAFRGTTLLDVTLATAREAALDQVVVALGGGADEVRARVDLSGTVPVVNPDFGDACATSIRSALHHVRHDAEGIVLL